MLFLYLVKVTFTSVFLLVGFTGSFSVRVNSNEANERKVEVLQILTDKRWSIERVYRNEDKQKTITVLLRREKKRRRERMLLSTVVAVCQVLLDRYPGNGEIKVYQR